MNANFKYLETCGPFTADDVADPNWPNTNKANALKQALKDISGLTGEGAENYVRATLSSCGCHSDTPETQDDINYIVKAHELVRGTIRAGLMEAKTIAELRKFVEDYLG